MKQIHFTYLSWQGHLIPSFIEYENYQPYVYALDDLKNKFKDSDTPLYSVEPELTPESAKALLKLYQIRLGLSRSKDAGGVYDLALLGCIKALKSYKVPPQTYNVVKVEVVYTESLYDLEELLEKAFENFYGDGPGRIINYRVIEDEEQRNKTLGDMLKDGWDWDAD